MRLLFFFGTMALYLFGSLTAQESVVRERTGSEMLMYEPLFLSSDSDTSTVLVPYRIRYDFFIFTLSRTALTRSYSASADVIAEILDSAGNSIARNIDHLDLTAGTNTAAELRKYFTQGLMTFRLPPGRYSVLLRAEDRESKRNSPNIEKPLNIPKPGTVVTSSFIPVRRTVTDSGTYILFNLGGDVMFSMDFGFAFLGSRNENMSAKVFIKRITGDDEDENEAVLDTLIICTPVPSTAADVALRNGEVALQPIPSSHRHLFVLPIDGSQLRQGRYELTLSADNSVLAVIPFAVRWLDMPASLYDLDVATYPLQYLLLEDDYSALRRGSRESRIKKFDEFWKQKDPTPATVYNEWMAEFYRRVDHAIVTYRTLKEPNGSLTDRGKIYILYGKPTTTDRLLTPGSYPKEIWKYDNLKKTFIFEDSSKQGNYKLAESK